jgi:hypothetical protein
MNTAETDAPLAELNCHRNSSEWVADALTAGFSALMLVAMRRRACRSQPA